MAMQPIRAGFVIMGIALAAVVGCSRSPSVAPPGARMAPVAFTTTGIVNGGEFTLDNALVTTIVTAGRAAKYDDKHDRVDGRRLLKGQCGVGSTLCVPGPYVRIVPRDKVHRTTSAQLDAGAIMAKLVRAPGETDVYPKLAVQGAEPTYWYIIRRAVPGSTTPLVSIYVPDNWNGTTVKAMWREVALLTNGGMPTSQSTARFAWLDVDDETWVTCADVGCCAPPAILAQMQLSPEM